jgi:hypothetical protein
MLLAVFWVGFLGATAIVIVVSHRRKMVPLIPIGEAPDAAPVRIAGRVTADNALRAPLSGRPCTCYYVSVVTEGSRRRTRWRFQDAAEFQLVDATGTASVPVDRPYLEVSADHIQDTTLRLLSDATRATLDRLGVKLDKVHSVQLYEAIIADGDEIEVVGSGLRRAIPSERRERGFRDPPSTLLELRGPVHLLGARREIRTNVS